MAAPHLSLRNWLHWTLEIFEKNHHQQKIIKLLAFCFLSRGDFSLIITIGNSGFISLLLVSNYIICDPITKNMFFIGFAPQITFSLWFDVNLRDELLCMHAFYHSLFSTINWSVRKNCVKQRRDQFRAKQSLITLFCILYTEYIVYSECIVYHRVW